MIKFENTEVVGWDAAIRGMRNPMNSWEKSDSESIRPKKTSVAPHILTELGPNDLDLMKRLVKAGTDHRKFMRMIVVYVDITAPLYWWKELDTYKVGTVANSCSTMHKIADKEFTLEDFSHEHLKEVTVSHNIKLHDETGKQIQHESVDVAICDVTPLNFLLFQIDALNEYRKLYLDSKNKTWWYQMIQLLPSSYNQKRTVMMSYEVLANIYKSRKNHKLDEWSVGFMDWIETLPYSELITGKED